MLQRFSGAKIDTVRMQIYLDKKNWAFFRRYAFNNNMSMNKTINVMIEELRAQEKKSKELNAEIADKTSKSS